MMVIRKLFALLLIGMVAMVAAGCATSPATGKSQLNWISAEQELRLGEEAQPVFIEDNGGEIPSDAILSYVRHIGQQLAEVSERPELPWEFHVLDSQQINAFALPGGKVFISRGLLMLMTNEAQLAGVLGHEVGHVTDQHMGQRMTQALLVQGVAVGLGVAGEVQDDDLLRALGIGAGAGGTMYLLKFNRDQETTADRLGLRYMTRLGYNPVGMLQVMEILAAASAGGQRQPEFFSTHPYPETRVKNLTRLIREEYPDFEDVTKYRIEAARFETQVLAPLRGLPPPRHGAQEQAHAGSGALWCAHCQHALEADLAAAWPEQ